MHHLLVGQVAQAAADRVEHSADLISRENGLLEPRDRQARFRHVPDFDLGALIHRMKREGVHKLAVELEREAKNLLKLCRDIEDSQMRRQPRNYDSQVM